MGIRGSVAPFGGAQWAWTAQTPAPRRPELNATIPAEALLAALGIALSPLSIVAVILALLSSRQKGVGVAYAVGWITGLSVMGVALLFVGDQFLAGREGPSDALLVVKALVGAALLVLGVKGLVEWRRSDEVEAEQPGWMGYFHEMTAARAFLFAAAWASLQPKNLALLAAGMLALAQSGLPPSDVWPQFFGFVALASLSVIVPVGYYAFAGDRADDQLDGWERWLTRNNAVLMGGLLGVIGLVLLVDTVPLLVG